MAASHLTAEESEPLLAAHENDAQVTATYGTLRGTTEVKRQIGIFSAVFIIFNRIIGTGIFATPSLILSLSGSVGVSMVMWIVGAIIAAAGMQVYIIWGTALPFNGGEKNYLEYLFPKQRRLVISMYAANAALLAWGAGNSLVFAEYAIASVSPASTKPSSLFSPVRLLAFCCLTGVVLLHGLHIPTGLRLQNLLGVLKLGILLIVVGTGGAALFGFLQVGVPRPDNFDSWQRVWEGSRGGGNVICACLYNVIWSFVGFSNVNYALAEVHNPARTLRIAGPLAMVVVTVFYLLCNLSYLAAASKQEITGSGRLVAALLFKNVWGSRMERVLSGFVALSALGNVLSVSFSQGRVNQALAAEGILPFSKVWASNWPYQAPLAGLTLHWVVCVIVVFALPPGDAYNFVINVISYPLAVVNAIISFGLIYLSLSSRASSSPIPRPTAGLLIPTLFFGLTNVFLVVLPMTPPPEDAQPYDRLPYWTHAADRKSVV